MLVVSPTNEGDYLMKTDQERYDAIGALSSSVNPYAPKMTELQRRTAFLLVHTTGVILSDVAEYFNVSVHTISMMKTHRHKYRAMKTEFKNIGREAFMNA